MSNDSITRGALHRQRARRCPWMCVHAGPMARIDGIPCDARHCATSGETLSNGIQSVLTSTTRKSPRTPCNVARPIWPKRRSSVSPAVRPGISPATTTSWSDETYQIMGFDRSVKPSIDLIMQRVHPDDRAHLQHEVDRATQGAQSHDYESRLLMPDGQIKYLHVRAHRVKYASGKEEIVGALMDITESRKSQAALDAAQTALAHASRVATLGEISASIAHEVNQPLAAIVANGQACLRFLRRETPDLNKLRGAIEWIVKDGKRADEVIRRVRGLLKKADTQKALFDVNDIVCEVTALLQRELSAQHVTLRLELASAMPLIVGDRVQLQQVIINLVVNGVDAIQAVMDRSHELLIRSYEDEAHQIVVAVKDSGVGIPAETADRLFDAFFSTKPSGLGIGLSICRSIIEDHGGRLWATNNTGEPGATFQFALPSHQERAP